MERNWEFGIASQLITKEALASRIRELGKEITRDFKDDETPLVVVSLLKGSIIFMADLVREIKLPLTMDFMQVSSYGDVFESSREVKIIKDLEDGVQSFSAEEGNLKIILTRNVKDFKWSNLTVLTPKEFLSSETESSL